jgi:hypothetical protein
LKYLRSGPACPFRVGNQVAVGAQHVAFVADVDELLPFGADVFDPDRARIGVAAVGLCAVQGCVNSSSITGMSS